MQAAAVNRLPARGRRVVQGCVLAVGCAALWVAWGTKVTHTAQSRPTIEPLSLGGGPAQAAGDSVELSGCDAALQAGINALQGPLHKWEAALKQARELRGFGRQADKALSRALRAFDHTEEDEQVAGTCRAQRLALMTKAKQVIWAVVTEQRQLAENLVAYDLQNDLLDAMERRGAALRVAEKMDILKSASKTYRDKVSALLPEWAADQKGLGQEEAERKFGEIQFGIETSGEGLGLRRYWEEREARQLASRRASGVSLSLDPALRVMIRPEGLGNLQVFSVGPVGPPNSPVKMNVGILNDGSIADVYREHPVPELFDFQPAVNLNLNLG